MGEQRLTPSLVVLNSTLARDTETPQGPSQGPYSLRLEARILDWAQSAFAPFPA